MILEAIALALAGIHFTIPVAYYFYMKKKYFYKAWDLKIDENYKPKVTIIIPTYNEAKFIRDRLDNIYAQNYPRNLMEVIVVDDGSDDETPEVVKEWIKLHPEFNARLILEGGHRGKLHALNTALKHMSPSSEVTIFTDADAECDENAIAKTLSYFADSKVGCVTDSITYTGEKIVLGEKIYRNYYNTLRISESKKYATPVHNGPFLAIRTYLLQQAGLPNYPGSDDSAFGSFIAFMGYRAIQADDVYVEEPIRGSQFRRKIRRAQLILRNFLKTKSFAKSVGVYVKSPFDQIWKIEWWLHVINPWLLVICTCLFLIGAFLGSFTALTFVILGLMLLISKACRMWVLQQLYLAIATIRNFIMEEITWTDRV